MDEEVFTAKVSVYSVRSFIELEFGGERYGFLVLVTVVSEGAFFWESCVLCFGFGIFSGYWVSF